MSEVNKRARIEYLQELYRATETDRQALRKVLTEIAVYCEAEPQTSAQAMMAKIAREALERSQRICTPNPNGLEARNGK